MAGGAVAYDAVTDTIHRVGSMGAVLLVDDEPTPVDAFVDDVAAATGTTHGDAESAVLAGIESMRSLGLLDRREPFWVPAPVTGSLLRDSTTALPPTDNFDISPGPTGRVCLQAAEEWDFPNRDNLFAQLPGVLNDFAARSHTLAVLHAGAVRTPTGRLVVISGDSASGKSTLVGALVQQGCAYFGDEMIGLRSNPNETLPYPKPLELDEESCRVLGVQAESPPHLRTHELRSDATSLTEPAGAVSEIAFPSFQPGHPTEVTRLDPDAALEALLGQTINLARAGEHGLRAVCELAETVPVSRIVHGDSTALAERLLANDGSAPTQV